MNGKKLKQLKELLQEATNDYKATQQYQLENWELPQVDCVEDLFEFWYLRGIETALSIIE